MGDTIELLRMIERVDAKIEALIQYLVDEEVITPKEDEDNDKKKKKDDLKVIKPKSS